MTVPSLLILGTDAVLAATPATPVQLVHACLAVGYQAVIPATWGDELIAGRVLDRLRETSAPVLQCSCPFVAGRLAIHGASLAPSVVAVASPPVATAKYLRALYAPMRPYITFAGACPSADHETIDVWLTPDALASALAERGISPVTQPTEFDSILPPDRRRFFSDPGGIPSLAALRDLPDQVNLAEPSADDLTAEVAQLLLSGSRLLIDVAPSLGCWCSGAREGIGATSARATVKANEPPRALGPVVDHNLPLVLEPVALAPSLPAPGVATVLPASADMPTRVAIETPAARTDVHEVNGVVSARVSGSLERPRSGAVVIKDPAGDVQVVEAAGRLAPGAVRAVLGTIPQTRTEAGRQLPRAYIARRRSTPRGVRSSGTGIRRSSGSSRRPVTRWLTATVALIGAGLLVAWLLQYYR